MREISPFENVSIEEIETCIKNLPSELRDLVYKIREQKRSNNRLIPSSNLVDHSEILSQVERGKLLDKVAELVDENLFGRSEMCSQFANLLNLALNHLGISSKAVLGKAVYYSSKGKELFQWEHAWVRIGREVIDGNVDSLFENPRVPKAINIKPYWGPINMTPNDRRLKENRGKTLPDDKDVSELWWPELRSWIEKNISFSK